MGDNYKHAVLSDLKPSSRIRFYGDILDLIFSIKDLQQYNPQVFEEMVDNIDGFFDLYKTVISGALYSGRYVQIAESKVYNAVNCLHSMVYSIPANRFVHNKLTTAHKRLWVLLYNKYLQHIQDLVTGNIAVNGYNRFTLPVNKGPKGANFYFDQGYTWQYY